MTARGLHPDPVVHIREPDAALQYYLDQGCRYIAIAALSSGSKRVAAGSRRETLAWYDRMSNIVVRSGRSDVRFHALGDAIPQRLTDFPLIISADSASWTISANRYATRHLPGIDSRTEEARARQTILEAERYAGIDHQIRATRPDFDFYLCVDVTNPWSFPVVWLVGHPKILVSYYYVQRSRAADTLRDIMERPLTVLERIPYAGPLKLLEQARDYLIEHPDAASAVLRPRDHQAEAARRRRARTLSSDEAN
jgi:hypothetical protein